MGYWKYTYRKINGIRRRVKVKKLANGKEKVRIVGHRNSTDGGH